MLIKGSVRRKSKEVFQKVLILRKQGHSYTEIRKETGIAKSTINNWLSYARLTLTKEHLAIQSRKRIENHVIATEASRITRGKRKKMDIQLTIEKNKQFFNDPLFNYGIALYESEGSKGTDCKFSNSDYRLAQTFLKFIEKYFYLTRDKNMTFAIYIHESRLKDLEKIKSFWADQIKISKEIIRIYWKKNIIVRRRENSDYVGQFSIRVRGERVLGSKLLAISDIILRKYQRN